MIATRQPRNAVGWILLAFGLMGAVQVPAALYADHHFAHHEGPLPGDEVAAWLSDWLGQTVLFAVVLFLPQLFPTGRPLTRRWRPVLWLAAIVLTGTTVGRMLMDGKLGSDPWIVDNPFGVLPIGVYDAFNVSGAFVLPLSFAALVVRFRRSRGDERLQLKWLVCAAAVMAFFFVGALAVGSFSSTLSDVFWATGILGFIALPIVTGIAILRYRLYEIDVIIKRTLLYGALTACVVGAYVVVIALAGTLLREQVGIGAAVVATGLVAVMFDPLRTRLQRAVNHLLYGERDDPATAVARLAQRLEVTAAPEAVLPGVVETVAQALRLPYVAIEVRAGRAARARRRARAALRPVGLAPACAPRGLAGAARARPAPGGRRASRRETAACSPIWPSTRARPCTPCGSRPTCSAPASASWPRARRSAARSGATSTTASARRWQASPCRSIWRVAAWAWTTPAALSMVEKLRAETQSAVNDVRRVIEALRPPDLDELGLAGAIRAIECETSGDPERAAVEREPAAARGAGVIRRATLLRRSLVYATVTALLLGAYVGLLLLIGPLQGTGQGLAVSLVTAIPVALLFGPLRRRLQRTVNRRLYGEDDDPHAAVRELGAHPRSEPDARGRAADRARDGHANAARALRRDPDRAGGRARARGGAGRGARRAADRAPGLRRRARGRARDRVAPW